MALIKADSYGNLYIDDPWYIEDVAAAADDMGITCLLYTSPSPRDGLLSRMPSSA